MRIEIHRSPSRRRRRGDTGARVVNLSALDGGGDQALTPISRPDNLSPVDHTLPAIDPNQSDARLAITQLIADLAAAGSLDAGTADVLDYWIDAQLAGWNETVKAQALDRRRTAARLFAMDVDNLTRESLELRQLRELMTRHQATYAHWRDQLNGHRRSTPPLTRAEPEGTRELVEPARLPTSLLEGHLGNHRVDDRPLPVHGLATPMRETP